jgi:hypothetical protein
MATINKTFLSFEGLQSYDTAIKNYISSSAGGKAVYITETAGSSSDAFSKRYGIYQGSGSAASPVPAEKISDIDIPKDMVVESGSVVDITFNSTDGKLYDGATDVTEIIKGAGGTATAADAGKYIKLIIANATSSVLYIFAKDLVDIYTVEQNATEIQLAISSANVISATVVSIDGSKIIYKTETSAGAGDGETVKAALTRLDGSDSTTGSVAKKVKDAIGALDTSSDVAVAAYTAGSGSGQAQTADVITLTGSVKEEDGIIAAGTADTITLSTITNAQISSLFSS